MNNMASMFHYNIQCEICHQNLYTIEWILWDFESMWENSYDNTFILSGN